MSYSLKITNGDLTARGSHLDIVQGVDKLIQDIDLWLREQYQVDRFHISFGSILDNFIGGVIDNTTKVEVQAEVLRVMNNYQNLQLIRFKNNPQKFSPDELLNQITSIQVNISYDKVIVSLFFTTAAGSSRVSSLTVQS